MKHAPQSDPKTRLKLALGALLYPQATRRWRQFLGQHACLQAQLQRHPVLAHKIYRPYLSTALGCAGRVQVLSEHYAHMQALGLLDWSCATANQPQTLATLALKDGGQAELTLSAIHDGHREGELCLALSREGQRLYALSFVIRHLNGQPTLVVGRLQGLACEQAREAVRDTTRQLHALRPSGLLVTLVRHLAYLLGCETVHLVSNEHRIALNLWRRWHISADYNQLWAELGALPGPGGDYQLSALAEVRIDLQSIPSKKRAEARRREALLRAACADMAERLHQAMGHPPKQAYPLAA